MRGWTRFVGLQIEYSLIERTPERELIPMAKAMGLSVTAWSPLGSGLLTGKYQGENSGAGGRLSHKMMEERGKVDDRKKAIVEAVLAVAKESGHSPAQVAISWVRQQGPDIIPILGASKTEQLKDTLGSLNVTLTDAQLARLNGASTIELGFPHDFFTKPMVRQFIYGGLYDQIDRK